MGSSPQAAVQEPATATQPPDGLVYYIDAAVEGALASSDSPLAGQPQHVRFGPFPSPLKFRRDTLEIVRGEEIIGYFGGPRGTWMIDGLQFTSLSIGALPCEQARPGSGVLAPGEPETMRAPLHRYSPSVTDPD
jgi:hypothetical protein